MDWLVCSASCGLQQELYKAIGQMVRTASNLPSGWRSRLVIVVHGDKIADHLKRVHALAELGISGLALATMYGMIAGCSVMSYGFEGQSGGWALFNGRE
jgi:hypothetical protein